MRILEYLSPRQNKKLECAPAYWALSLGVLSWLGLLVCWPLSVLLGGGAMVYGIVGLVQMGRNPGLEGKGQAIAGIVLGGLAAGIWIVVAAMMLRGAR